MEFTAGLPAIAIEGARGVGKTATAERLAATVLRLEDPSDRVVVETAPERLRTLPTPVLLDEWQRIPWVWDSVRRAVDDGAPPGSFLLTGSVPPVVQPTHSGAGRIVGLRMRPLSIAERGLDAPTVSLASLMTGARPRLEGETAVGLTEYTEEIVASGFPGLRGLPPRLRALQLDDYIEALLTRDFDEAGFRVRAPATLRRWLAAYAAATGTTATYETIRRAAAAADGSEPARSTTQPYREALTALHLLDPVFGWTPIRRPIARVSLPEKHHLVDPALTARLLRVGAEELLGPPAAPASGPRDGPLLGALFESLVTQSVRVYAEVAGGWRIGHFRTRGGHREVDLMVEAGLRALAIEVKLGAYPTDRDVRHLLWLKDQLGEDLVDTIVITAGRHAYRRPDGIGVVPLALLGP